MASQIVSPEKRYWMSLLLDTYGELLTEKQRTFMRRYYEQDFSFGEIAREFDVSRQAIFDAAKVTRIALQSAASVAGLMLTTEVLLTDLSDKDKDAPIAHAIR